MKLLFQFSVNTAQGTHAFNAHSWERQVLRLHKMKETR